MMRPLKRYGQAVFIIHAHAAQLMPLDRLTNATHHPLYPAGVGAECLPHRVRSALGAKITLARRDDLFSHHVHMQ
jgi:hypothetical protein